MTQAVSPWDSRTTTKTKTKVGKMAQFRAIIRGQRGEASRLGSKQSGIVAHVDGWHTGATVRMSHVDGRDLVSVYRTGGSAGTGSEYLVAQWFATESVQLHPFVLAHHIEVGS